ncbi:hypothetical protein O3M35_011200 [Rhynocoris fuscipes]|uniref:Uncharacterized protein n=1 Tax=Rhynocoris fuscipes TaxID=488301 RepID=A0AAW1CX88_9HEMI
MAVEAKQNEGAVIPRVKMMNLVKEALLSDNSVHGLNFVELLKHVSETENVPRNRIVPRLLETLDVAQEIGHIRKLPNNNYGLVDKIKAFCGSCGKRRAKASCGTPRKRRKDCGKKRRTKRSSRCRRRTRSRSKCHRRRRSSCGGRRKRSKRRCGGRRKRSKRRCGGRRKRSKRRCSGKRRSKRRRRGGSCGRKRRHYRKSKIRRCKDAEARSNKSSTNENEQVPTVPRDGTH